MRGWLRIPLVASVSMDDQHRGRSGIEHLVADAAQDKGRNLAARPRRQEGAYMIATTTSSLAEANTPIAWANRRGG